MANRYWVGGTGTWDGTAGTKWSTTSGGAGGSAVPTTADIVFFDAASGAGTVTLGINPTVDFLTFSGFTGTFAFGTNNITLSATTANQFTGSATMTVTGTPVINISTTTGSIGIFGAAMTEANSISFNITGTNTSAALAVTGSVKNLNFGTATGALAINARTIYGNLTLSSTMSLTAGTSVTTFAATSGTQTITSAGLTLDFPITFSGTATYQLVDDLSVGTATIRNITLTGGTLDLNDKTLTNFGQFASSSSNTRSILFGTTGNYTNTCTLTSTVVSMATATGFTYTGTPTVNLTGNAVGVTRTVAFSSTTGGTETNSFNYNISAGSGSVALNGTFKDINFTGFTGQLTSGTRTIYGNLTLVSGMTVSTSTNTTTFAATSGTQTITSAAQTLDFPVTIDGVGGTVQLVDALTLGSTRTLTLTNGTFNSDAKSVTVGRFSATNSNTKTFTITNSTFTVAGGTTTTGFIFTTAGTTFNVTGSNIVFTTSGNTVYYGGTTAAVTYPQVTMSGTGILNIGFGQTTSSITTLTNTVQPCTISVSTTSQLTVTNFNLNGTPGNPVTFNSNVPGTARTISKSSGTVNALYLNIQDSTATGGATWNALDSTNAGNNTGWTFITLPSTPVILSGVTISGGLTIV